MVSLFLHRQPAWLNWPSWVGPCLPRQAQPCLCRPQSPSTSIIDFTQYAPYSMPSSQALLWLCVYCCFCLEFFSSPVIYPGHSYCSLKSLSCLPSLKPSLTDVAVSYDSIVFFKTALLRSNLYHIVHLFQVCSLMVLNIF